MKTDKPFNGYDMAERLYSSGKKKKLIKRIERVKAPDHWDKDFDSNKLKLEQSQNHE